MPSSPHPLHRLYQAEAVRYRVRVLTARQAASDASQALMAALSGVQREVDRAEEASGVTQEDLRVG